MFSVIAISILNLMLQAFGGTGVVYEEKGCGLYSARQACASVKHEHHVAFKPKDVPFHFTVFGFSEEAVGEFKALVDRVNLKSDASIKIECTRDGTLQLKQSKYEMRAFMAIHPELKDYLCDVRGRLSFGERSVNFSRKGLWFVQSKEIDLFDELEKRYADLPLQAIPKVTLPSCEGYSGTKAEIETIFTGLLSNAPGLVIGELHEHLSPKKVLIEQMSHLYGLGVRTLFLEHCCYDTLQEELNRFYLSKKPSLFLKEFLSHGCGGAVGEVDYFDLVASAVAIGIRPVGVELSATQNFGYQSIGGCQGRARFIGMNVPAQGIMAEERGNDKYIALVGSAHTSYCHNVAGLSELCGVPAMVIADGESGQELAAYQKGAFNLGLNMLDPKNDQLFNNAPNVVFYTHAYLRCVLER